jgi:Cft2 family RNA processing exonuclease
MKIILVGAAGGEVTGSCYIVETKQARILIDCGLFQGGKKSEALNRPPKSPNGTLDSVLLTHGHLDHTGRLPLLARMGYTGPVYGTPATLDMTGLILRDSARLQVADTERKNRKRLRAGEPPQEPLYTPDDAENILSQLRPVPYQKEFEVAPGIKAIWNDAGHMLGSASIQLIVQEDGKTKRVVFSGDLGPRSAPILREFEPFHQADLVFLESTYGGRDHRSFAETVAEFERIVIDSVNRGGKMLVPTFAVGRAQLIALLLAKMFRAGRVKPFPIFLDSPMAVEATNIYVKHMELFDDRRRISRNQRRPGRVSCHGRRGNVQRRPHSSSSQGQSLEAKHARADRRLSGSGLAGPTACGWCERSEVFRGNNRGESDDSHTRRIQRARGANRFNALVRCDRTEQAARGIDPRRRRPARGACQTHSTAPPVTIDAADDGRSH